MQCVMYQYGRSEPPSALQAASLLLSDPQPHTRQMALQVLSALSQPHNNTPDVTTSGVDAIFQHLCVVAATDSVARLRLQALEALSEMHHASTAIKLQALSKKATLRVMLPSAAPPAAAAAASRGTQQPPAKKQKQHKHQQQQQQQDPPSSADAALLDGATGALVHGTEDDLPRVRLAAVAAVVSLSSKDPLFADAAGFLLADLVGDQLLEVRVAALQALLAHATAFQQRKQQAQQVQQQQQEQFVGTASDAAATTPAAAAQAADLTDTDIEEAVVSPAKLHQGAKSSATAAQDGAASGSEQQQQQEPQQQQTRRANKVRKSDLPSWGKDALLAAAAVLTDKAPAVRHLALQLLLLLPPANMPDLVRLVQGLMGCCELWPGQHAAELSAVVEQLAHRRAEIITLAAAKLVPLLARALATYTAPASAVAAVPAAVPAAAAAAGAAECDAGSSMSTMSQLPFGAQLLTSLLWEGVQQRKQGLDSLLKELGKAGLLQQQPPVLRPWVAQVQALHENYQQQRRRQGEQQQQGDQQQQQGPSEGQLELES